MSDSPKNLKGFLLLARFCISVCSEAHTHYSTRKKSEEKSVVAAAKQVWDTGVPVNFSKLSVSQFVFFEKWKDQLKGKMLEADPE